MPESIPIAWSARETPLAPAGLAARGAAAARLIERLRALPDERLARLEGARGDGIVVLLGAPEDLPWVDGVTYLGREPDAAGLLAPTHRGAGAPAPLVEAALRAQARLPDGPFAVLLDPLAVVPLAALRRIERAALEG